MSILDYYEIRARFIPTFIVVLPIIFTINFILSNNNVHTLSSLGSNLVLVIMLLYPFSFFIRHCGKKIEAKLWYSWNGPPSTRFLRWRDTTFGNEHKQQLHEAVETKLDIKLLSKQVEYNNNELADSQINQAFMQVRSLIRQRDPDGLAHKHNAEYGFNRNLMGSRIVWLILSTLGTIICVNLTGFMDYTATIYLYLNILWFFMALIGGWVLLPKFVEESANRYSESAWSTFLTLSKE